MSAAVQLPPLPQSDAPVRDPSWLRQDRVNRVRLESSLN